VKTYGNSEKANGKEAWRQGWGRKAAGLLPMSPVPVMLTRKTELLPDGCILSRVPYDWCAISDTHLSLVDSCHVVGTMYLCAHVGNVFVCCRLLVNMTQVIDCLVTEICRRQNLFRSTLNENCLICVTSVGVVPTTTAAVNYVTAVHCFSKCLGNDTNVRGLQRW
jgi:hypothetical protein